MIGYKVLKSFTMFFAATWTIVASSLRKEKAKEQATLAYTERKMPQQRNPPGSLTLVGGGAIKKLSPHAPAWCSSIIEYMGLPRKNHNR